MWVESPHWQPSVLEHTHLEVSTHTHSFMQAKLCYPSTKYINLFVFLACSTKPHLLFYTSVGRECLSPMLMDMMIRPVPKKVGTTNTTISLQWVEPELPPECADVFSFPPLNYTVLVSASGSFIFTNMVRNCLYMLALYMYTCLMSLGNFDT